MAGEVAFAAPRAEEMTKMVTGLAGAGITGVVEGVMVKMAPQLGAAAPIVTWGALLGVPLVGGFGALFTRGILGDLCQGVANGGIAVLGYSLPELLAPITGKRTRTSSAQFRAGENVDVKQLPAGAASAAQRAQQAASAAQRATASLEF